VYKLVRILIIKKKKAHIKLLPLPNTFANLNNYLQLLSSDDPCMDVPPLAYNGIDIGLKLKLSVLL
jgi:hypothetical protein